MHLSTEIAANYEQVIRDRGWTLAQLADDLQTTDPRLAAHIRAHGLTPTDVIARNGHQGHLQTALDADDVEAGLAAERDGGLYRDDVDALVAVMEKIGAPLTDHQRGALLAEAVDVDTTEVGHTVAQEQAAADIRRDIVAQGGASEGVQPGTQGSPANDPAPADLGPAAGFFGGEPTGDATATPEGEPTGDPADAPETSQAPAKRASRSRSKKATPDPDAATASPTPAPVSE